MTKLEQLRDIAARLEEATEGSRELSCCIAVVAPANAWPCAYPKYSESIDAALGLVERTLPGWGIGIAIDVDAPRLCQCRLRQSTQDDHFEEDAPTAPLAILRAWVAAMIAQEEGGE